MSEPNEKNHQSFRWALNWKICAFSLLFLPLLVTLGFWQLSRADEKRTLQDEWAKQQAMPPVSLSEARQQNKDVRYRNVRVTGQFDNERYWLVENKVYQGRQGYWVLMPFQSQFGEWLMVNRGWVPAGVTRDILPEVEKIEGEVRLVGMLARPSYNNLLDDDSEDALGENDQWPVRVLQMNLVEVSALLNQDVGQNVMHIDPSSRGALIPMWSPINMSREKHIGYATQWFAMAVALIVLSVFANSNLSEWIRSKRQR